MDEPTANGSVLPQLGSEPFLTDAGLETYLIFHRDIELPEFASFDLLKDEAGVEELRRYYRPFLELAAEHGLGFVLESPTWRANPDWGATIGYDDQGLADANRRAVALMEELRDAAPDGGGPIVISGNVGPRGDGYVPGETMTPEQAEEFHSAQIGVLAEAGVDLVSALTINYVEEAIGVARAGREKGVPVAISFTVETDGRVATGQSIGEAIDQVDADPGSDVAYYMLNCAHPTHFEHELDAGAAWAERIAGLRANASTLSHAELDAAVELDDGDALDLAGRYARLREAMPRLNVLGGCCGTDYSHVAEICAAVTASDDEGRD